MIADGLIAGFYAVQGQQIGITINAFLFIPFSQGGIVLQDSAGGRWLLKVDSTGSLFVDSFTL